MGWISSTISSVCSTVSSGFSSVCSAVSSACSAIGSSMSATFSGLMGSLGSATSLLGGMSSVLSVITSVVNIIGTASLAINIIGSILQSLGLVRPDEDLDELGQDILDAYEAGIKPLDYSTYDEYMAAIRAFKLENPDREKGEYTLIEKRVASLASQSWGLEEKFGTGSSGLIVSVLKDAPNLEKKEGYFTEERIESWSKNVSNLADVGKYFSGKLNLDDANRVEQNLIKAEQQLNPDKSLDLIYQDLDKYRQEAN